MTQYDKIKNICYYTFVSGYILFVFFYFFNVPINGDLWLMKWNLSDIYFLPEGWAYHPGRNFGEHTTIFPKIFSQLLSFIPEPLYRFKIVRALVDTILVVSLAYVSAYIVGIKKQLAFVIFLFSIFYFSSLKWSNFNSIAVLPMLYVSLLPMIFYLRDHTLPQWMKDNPYKTFGYWAVFCYMGSQVYDPVYFMGTIFCGMVQLYLIGLYCIPNLFEQKIKDKTSFYLTGSISIFYILLSFMGAFKNTTVSGRFEGYENLITLDFSTIVERAKLSQGFMQTRVVIISFIFAIVAGFRFIKNKMIDGKIYVYIALTTSSIFSLLLITIIGSTHVNFVTWSSFIVIVTGICYLWKEKTWSQVFIPTLVFGIFINVLVNEYNNKIPIPHNPNQAMLPINNSDIELVRKFQQAENKGQTQILIDHKDIEYFKLVRYMIIANDGTEFPMRDISFAMLQMGYTKSSLPIIVSNLPNNPNK